MTMIRQFFCLLVVLLNHQSESRLHRRVEEPASNQCALCPLEDPLNGVQTFRPNLRDEERQSCEAWATAASGLEGPACQGFVEAFRERCCGPQSLGFPHCYGEGCSLGLSFPAAASTFRDTPNFSASTPAPTPAPDSSTTSFSIFVTRGPDDTISVSRGSFYRGSSFFDAAATEPTPEPSLQPSRAPSFQPSSAPTAFGVVETEISMKFHSKSSDDDRPDPPAREMAALESLVAALLEEAMSQAFAGKFVAQFPQHFETEVRAEESGALATWYVYRTAQRFTMPLPSTSAVSAAAENADWESWVADVIEIGPYLSETTEVLDVISSSAICDIC